ncbi:MAG: hypothetical protein DLM53_08630 [Candidatus Eremiobacter antarcticus]|nr:sulfite exporter TauE/SafE family protein [Candidatus Eremiobacteraeota bacterium]MBC5809106.1 sulfite exporter TauE/SafE family protein [Candidatus Eremiobacteraeota bacterium]PZR61639.1 MAG: hypothetical protein DLM53_08630 [Candidatus Eremiobacter sp. RRmetagenome_bin22]
MNVALIAAGLFVGLLVGLTGVGGGSIMTPLLVVVLRVNPLVAVGTDLLYSAPMKLYGAYIHYRQGTTNAPIVKALCLGGIPGALVGLALLGWLRHHVDVHVVELWTRHAIAVMIFLAAALILRKPLSQGEAPSDSATFSWPPSVRRRVVALGAFVGLVVSLTSIGSGSVTLPLLALALPLVGLPTLVGSDIAFAAFLIPVAAAGRWSMGDVNLGITANLLAGSLPGVYIGSKLCRRLHQQWLRPIVALALAFVGVRLI